MVNFDAFSSISDLNAVTNPIINTRALDDVLPALDTCLAELIFSLASARTSGLRDSETKKFINDALVTPFNEAARSLSQLFIPDQESLEQAAEVGGTGQMVTEYTSQVVEAIRNPIAAILQQQSAVFEQGVERVGDILLGTGDSGRPGQSGVVGEIYDQVEFLLTDLFTSEQRAGRNLGGLLMFAIDEVVPSIDLELTYLKRMRQSITTTVEEVSKLPASLVPQLPSVVGSIKLCDVERHLNRVIDDLRRSRRWNRSEFSAATQKVCATKDILVNGVIPFEDRGLVKNITGWDDRQLNAIQGLKFMPNASYRVATVELVSLNTFVQQHDVSVIAFHRNVNSLLDTLRGIVNVHVSDVISLIVEVLRNQIRALRADLEAQSQGIGPGVPAGMPDSVVNPSQTNELSTGVTRTNKQYVTDVYAQMSTQLSGYVVLSGLCFIMERTQQIYSTVEAILSNNSRFTRMILKFVDYYGASDCGTDNGSAIINSKLQSFLRASEDRLRGRTRTNEVLRIRADELRVAIRQHERFLTCIRDRMFLGRTNIIEKSTLFAGAATAAKNLWSLVHKQPDIYETIRDMDIKKVFGIEKTEYNALDAVMRALQCIVLQCDNQFVSSLARLAQTQFQGDFDRRKARSLTVSSLDEMPKISRESAQNARVAAFLRTIQSLQRLTSVDISELCQVPTNQLQVTPTNQPTVSSGLGETDLSGPPSDRAAQLARETAARQQQSSDAIPYGQTDLDPSRG